MEHLLTAAWSSCRQVAKEIKELKERGSTPAQHTYSQFTNFQEHLLCRRGWRMSEVKSFHSHSALWMILSY
jgi:hypothetical protein